MLKHLILAASLSLVAVACGGGTQEEAKTPDSAGGDAAKPAEGGDAAKPAEGGDAAKPAEGGDAAKPADAPK